MTAEITYKGYLVRGESFQRQKDGTWVPQYALNRQDNATTKIDFPSHQYQFNHAYPTLREANEYAVESARWWIDMKTSQ